MPPCPHCRADNPIVEIEGLRLHTFADHWISCTGFEKQQKPVAPVRHELATLVRNVYRSICGNSSMRLRRCDHTLGNLRIPSSHHN
jgi:hypothetical protein